MSILRNCIALFLFLPLGIYGQIAPFSTVSTPDVRKARAWTHITSDNFDVWFNPSEKILGEQAAKYAEYHMRDLCHLLDYSPRSRFVLHVYPSPGSYWHSPQYRHPNTLPQGGQTRLDGNSIAVWYGEGQQDLYRQVRQAVCRVLMNEIYYGQHIQFSMQQQMMLDMPDWFRDGIPAFEGEGWTPEDDARMRSLSARNYVSLAMYNHSPEMSRTLQKSIWFYISRRFSPVKVYSIMYMTRVSRSVQSGFITVLGIGMETFTDRWREFYVQRYQADASTRRSLSKESKEIKSVPDGYRLCSSALHPQGDKLASVGEKKGKYKLFIYYLNTGKRKEWSIPAGMPSYLREVSDLPVPLAWNHEGSKITMVLNDKAIPYFYTFGLSAEKFNKGKLPGALEQIHALDWNHEKDWMVISGSRKGQCDLFVLNPAGNLVQLTHDLHDDLKPIWSKDEQSIYFASNRAFDASDNFAPEAVRRDLDIFRYNLADDSIYRITETPFVDEIPLFQPTAYELVYLNNESGINGLSRRNVFTPDSMHLTIFDAGIVHAQTRNNRAVLNAWHAGRQSTFLVDNLNMSKGLKPQFTETGKERRNEYTQWIEFQNKKNAPKDSVPDVPEAGELIQVQPVEKPDPEEKKPLKYYLFDEEDSPRKTSEPGATRIVGNQPSAHITNIPVQDDYKKLPVNWAEAELKTPKNASLKRSWYLRELGTGMAFDPIFRYHLDLYAGISDIHRQHEIIIGYRPYFNYRSSDFYSMWEYKKNRLQPGASFQRAVRFYDQQGFALRYTVHTYRAWLGWSFNRNLRLNGGLRYESIWRKDLSLVPGAPLGDEIFIPGTFLQLNWDHTQKRENIIMAGTYARLGWDNYLITGTKRSDGLAVFHMDLRKYTRILKESVFAVRLSGSFSLGAVKPLITLGGVDNWVNARFQNPQEIPVPNPTEGLWLMQVRAPIRGFPYNARNGTRFFAINSELRFPILKYLTRALHTNPLYNFQLVAFYDIGTVWSQGNPLSQKNPVNSVIIDKNPFIIHVQSLKSPFIAGVGGGLRMSIMRYIVRMDVGIGLEDGSEAKPQFSIGLGKDF